MKTMLMSTFGKSESNDYVEALSPSQIQSYKEARPEVYGGQFRREGDPADYDGVFNLARDQSGRLSSDWRDMQNENRNRQAFQTAEKAWQNNPTMQRPVFQSLLAPSNNGLPSGGGYGTANIGGSNGRQTTFDIPKLDWNNPQNNPYMMGQSAAPAPQQAPQNNTQPFQQTQAYQSAMQNQYTQPQAFQFQQQQYQTQQQAPQVQQFQPQGLLQTQSTPTTNQNRYGLLSAYGTR